MTPAPFLPTRSICPCDIHCRHLESSVFPCRSASRNERCDFEHSGPDGTAHKNRMQGNDFAQSLMYARGVTCFSCHDPHGTDNVGMVRKPGNALCLDCHGPNAEAGPHAPTIEAHTHHQAGSAGNECTACHMPVVPLSFVVAPVATRNSKEFISPSSSN
jgi:predicted CXXCH cytochrome family protein